MISADDFVRARFAGRVVDDDRRAFRRQMLGDGRADAFGRARDDRDLAVEFLGVIAHMLVLSCLVCCCLYICY